MATGETVTPSIAKSNHFERYFQYAEAIISAYKGNQPFHLYLKNYFSSNKKHGSRDRKIITSLCYNYFRVVAGVSSENNFKEIFLLANFLCETISSPILYFYKSEWDASIQLPIKEKLEIGREEFDINKLFPFEQELSDEIDFQKFCLSFLNQPKLFIKIRPGFKVSIIDKIKKANLTFEEINGNCLAFRNNEKVNSIIEIDKEAVVQDINSQKTFNLLSPVTKALNEEITIWDCCAGAGGKSILAFDLFNKKEIDKYVALQRNIIKNAIPQLKKNGHLLYITCSGFKKENEENVSFIEQNLPLKLVKMSYLKGYEIQADTLFVALFKTPDP